MLRSYCTKLSQDWKEALPFLFHSVCSPSEIKGDALSGNFPQESLKLVANVGVVPSEDSDIPLEFVTGKLKNSEYLEHLDK